MSLRSWAYLILALSTPVANLVLGMAWRMGPSLYHGAADCGTVLEWATSRPLNVSESYDAAFGPLIVVVALVVLAVTAGRGAPGSGG